MRFLARLRVRRAELVGEVAQYEDISHVEVYLRELEAQQPPPANSTLSRRIATLNSWFRWLEDEELTVGNPAARVRRPQRHPARSRD